MSEGLIASTPVEKTKNNKLINELFNDPNFINKLQENIKKKLKLPNIQFNFVNARTLQSGGAIDINKNEIKIVTYNVHQNRDDGKIRKETYY